MSQHTNKYATLQRLTSAILVLATVATLLSSKSAQLRVLTDYTAQFTIALLAVALIALVFNYTKVMATSFFCCAAMCVFLKDAGNENLRYAQENQEDLLHLGQFNVSNVNRAYQDMIEAIDTSSFDIVSFQEVDPYWATLLEKDLSRKFPYHHIVPRVDPYGLALFSRRPFLKVDTFQTGNLPHITISIEINDQPAQLIASYVTPALDLISTETARRQLSDISDWASLQVDPMLAIGDYNMVYWTDELRAFKSETTLVQSRRESSPVAADLPQEHIFFSQELECTSFAHLYSEDKTYLGIKGSYQVRTVDDDYQARLIKYQESSITQ